jgi:phosphate transport system substrate-binding protein
MKPKTRTAMMAAAAIALLLTATSLMAKGREPDKTPEGKPALSGAGSTFIAPLLEQWIKDYHKVHPEVRIDYAAIGTGEGVDRFVAGTVDFAASDGGTSDAQVAAVNRGVRFIPATIGGVVLAYNVQGLTGGLKLPRAVYTDIFLGKIRTWDDPRIKAANPDLPLPRETIVPVVRLDSSGTTFAFTNHLSAISEEWRQGPGVGRRVDWPGHAMTARGNEGVAARIKHSEGAIGYVEYGFAQRLGLRMAVLENRAGQFVAPEAPRIARVFEDSIDQMPVDLRLYVPDPAGESVYPIATYSWLLLYGHYPDADKATALKDFVRFGLTQGQLHGGHLGYVPLPGIVSALAQQALDTVQ